jgi:hypothetical protein
VERTAHPPFLLFRHARQSRVVLFGGLVWKSNFVVGKTCLNTFVLVFGF